jgi:hypothetical protein
MDDAKREALARSAEKGTRARIALEELEGFKARTEEAVLTALAGAATPDEAFRIAAEYRAANGILAAMRAAVSVGSGAAQKLLNLKEGER